MLATQIQDPTNCIQVLCNCMHSQHMHVSTSCLCTIAFALFMGQGPSPIAFSFVPQVAAVCDQLASIPQLSQGYNAVGFSQGSQFLRAVLQRCQHVDGMPKMHKLITLGGQHQGIMNGPACSGPSFNHTPSTSCKMVQRLLGFGAYLPWIRSHIVQAQYFKVNLQCRMPKPAGHV